MGAVKWEVTEILVKKNRAVEGQLLGYLLQRDRPEERTSSGPVGITLAEPYLFLPACGLFAYSNKRAF